MPALKQVAGKTQLEVERFDGGLNTKDSPSRIGIFESPDCLNVIFDDQGSVTTRLGVSLFNTSTIEPGSNVIDGIASYNGSMVAWAGGSMFRVSGTTLVTIASAQGQFTSGANVAHAIYQRILFCSDGTNGPWRYEGPSDFYRMGIAVPSAPTGVCNVAGANQVETGTYYYSIAYRNSHVVDGEAGSQSVAVVLTTTSAVNVTSIPTGAQSLGVHSRIVYRASNISGPYREVGVIANNTASTFTDTMGATTWAVATRASDDATAPTPFTTIKLKKEVLFFDDSADRTVLRYTDYTSPFISQAENTIPLNQGDQANITALGDQDDLLSVFKDNSIWVVDMVAPADDTTWQYFKCPVNMGIVGPNALAEIPNGIAFLGKLNGRLSGLHVLSGVNVVDTANSLLKTDSISERIENDMLAFNSAFWSRFALGVYRNKLFIAVAKSGDASISHLYWLDMARLGGEGQPGSWSLWDGRAAKVQCFVVHSGNFFAGSSQADGAIVQMEKTGQYNDAGSAINSYMWTKELGGEGPISSWIKDFRRVNVWYFLAGAWFMNVRYRVDGDSSDGVAIPVTLDPGGTLWGSATWGTSTWGGGRLNMESQLSLGSLLGRRIQLRFDNQNTVNQYFKVHRIQLDMNLRRQSVRI